MADVDVRAHARMAALVDEAHHRIDVVEQAEAERFQFQRDVDFLLCRVIAESSAGFEAPLPLGFGGNDFALPDVFPEHEQDIFRAPLGGEVDEFFACARCETRARAR